MANFKELKLLDDKYERGHCNILFVTMSVIVSYFICLSNAYAQSDKLWYANSDIIAAIELADNSAFCEFLYDMSEDFSQVTNIRTL